MKNQLIKTSISVLLVFISVLALAQPPMERSGRFDREEAKTLKVGIYTRVLELTSKEAQSFWPVFNEFESKMEDIKEEQRKLRDEVEENFSTFSDSEVEQRLDRMMELHVEEAELVVLYSEKYKDVLPIKKVALIHRAEMMYKRALLEKMRDRRSSSPSGR